MKGQGKWLQTEREKVQIRYQEEIPYCEGRESLAQVENLWLPHPWKCPRPGWMGLGETWGWKEMMNSNFSMICDFLRGTKATAAALYLSSFFPSTGLTADVQIWLGSPLLTGTPAQHPECQIFHLDKTPSLSANLQTLISNEI